MDDHLEAIPNDTLGIGRLCAFLQRYAAGREPLTQWRHSPGGLRHHHHNYKTLIIVAVKGSNRKEGGCCLTAGYALFFNDTLRNVNLSHNGVTARGVFVIAMAIRHNQIIRCGILLCITTLSLSSSSSSSSSSSLSSSPPPPPSSSSSGGLRHRHGHPPQPDHQVRTRLVLEHSVFMRRFGLRHQDIPVCIKGGER
jgi:hypothetical protein